MCENVILSAYLTCRASWKWWRALQINASSLDHRSLTHISYPTSLPMINTFNTGRSDVELTSCTLCTPTCVHAFWISHARLLLIHVLLIPVKNRTWRRRHASHLHIWIYISDKTHNTQLQMPFRKHTWGVTVCRSVEWGGTDVKNCTNCQTRIE